MDVLVRVAAFVSGGSGEPSSCGEAAVKIVAVTDADEMRGL